MTFNVSLLLTLFLICGGGAGVAQLAESDAASAEFSRGPVKINGNGKKILSAKYTSLDTDGPHHSYPSDLPTSPSTNPTYNPKHFFPSPAFPTHSQQAQQPQSYSPYYQGNEKPNLKVTGKRPQYPSQSGGTKVTSSEERELQELEDEQKPDRLQELLVNSKFECSGKKDGYYADDTLNCEVFHYCQAGAKHSWLCPDGFSFHQIHLICVPPSADNICQKSSDFHFVNDYLYRPINSQQAQQYNMSLKYAERYYPEGYGEGGRELIPYTDNNDGRGTNGVKYFEESEEDYDDDKSQIRHPTSKQSFSQQQQPARHSLQQSSSSNPRQHHQSIYTHLPAQLSKAHNFQRPQVPAPSYSKPQKREQSQNGRYYNAAQYPAFIDSAQRNLDLPEYSSSLPKSLPYRELKQTPTEHQQNFFFHSPSQINIPLAQRRPIPKKPGHVG